MVPKINGATTQNFQFDRIRDADIISLETLSVVGWTGIIMAWIIDFGFSAAVIYFFTRPKVKEQFK